ncbi:POU domain, class 6, transcription factor 2 isoform X2 [Anthonomus grandis grandis]|uniref:POU domain, class 6, transcription factor 2 isoform X2 n=1 Tax=Anthonomus grandis grandis TaxID=2921223 RepID=UPI0021651223|nr:POU domain, class 6, transcription factor 2 isoform X2 [Anthonomus grandis grandis]
MPMHAPSAPTNLSIKEEESDCSESSSVGSPSPATDAAGCTDLSICPSRPTMPPQAHPEDHHHIQENKMPSPGPPSHTTMQQQLNGTMASLATLQNLQNLASLHQSLPQVATLAANLTNMANLHTVQSVASSNASMVNGPLNLSVNAASATTPRSQPSSIPCEMPTNSITPLSSQPPPAPSLPPPNPLLQSPQPAPMPQFILASGQLVQGIQGAQLLIPTSQGLATQTILTIPVNHVNSSDQMVNLALNNGQVMQTSLANLQAMAAQSNLLANTPPPHQVSNTNGAMTPQSLLNPATLTHLLSTPTSAQQLLQSLPQMISNPHTPPQPTPLLNSLTQPLLNQSAPYVSQSAPMFPQTTPLFSQATTPSSQTPPSRLPMGNGHYGEVKPLSSYQPPTISRNSSPPGINGGGRSSVGASDISVPTSLGAPSIQNVRRSPSSLSPGCNDSSTADLLIDSPNQPTINQTNSNVVDGINLDEIKDFAKAFKLRRLSLGLTQTQVGQALSVTEGPAYSQSAICSALASQMVAAAQQQAMFEKLDITPKSAQKIKPVLERWMKEAEERYKSGQNHLTDFIGIEPSKKRKRRTSFTPQALELLNAHFERNTHPSGTEITGLAHQLGYEREVIRIWFCNKRQALKNTVRMMSKGMV